MLHEDVDDVLSLVILNLVLDLFIDNPLNVGIYLQEELIDLHSNEEIQPRMERGYEYFWLHEEIRIFPISCPPGILLLITIPSLPVVERGFSVVTDLVAKKRNCLKVVNQGDLRLRVTSVRLNIERIQYLTFGFICCPTNRSLPMCVLCQRVLSNEAEQLKEHLTEVHPGRSREIVAPTSRTPRSVIRVERDSGKPHTIEEQLLVPVVNDVLRTVFHNSESDISRKFSISKDCAEAN
ncbi:hypothetical protein M514_24015 [Trichuris suis]|uniref:Uncharacterized protein n=1 Tax=Trichuris suis TaxID=68888 RepID=A0A085N321_9BILA|nr:hypothetical protein M514_24015 [Trichuris suis]